jgi:hypothetical protein
VGVNGFGCMVSGEGRVNVAEMGIAMIVVLEERSLRLMTLAQPSQGTSQAVN